MHIGFHVKYPLFLSDFNEIEFFRQTFERYSHINFHWESSCSIWTDRQTWRS